MNMKRFVFSLVAIVFILITLFLLFGVVKLSPLWFAKNGFPSIESVEMIAGIAGKHSMPTPFGYGFIATVIPSSLVLLLMFYRAISNAVGTFAFQSNYFIGLVIAIGGGCPLPASFFAHRLMERYATMKRGKGTGRTIVATARTPPMIIWCMLTANETFDPGLTIDVRLSKKGDPMRAALKIPA